MQATSDRIQNKIVSKLDMVTEVQTEVESLLDAVSEHISNFEVDAVNGESSDMLLQKQIVSSTQLVDKVNALRERIDAGDLDDRSNIGSILNTQLDANDQPIDFRAVNQAEKAVNPDMPGILGRIVGQKAKVRRVEKDLGTSNVSMRHDAVQFSDTFVVTTSATKEADEKDTSQTEQEDAGEASEELPGPMTREELDKLNASEVRKLSKYNNLYDRLRKKRDELSVLFAQRKFLSLVYEQRNKPEYLARIAELVLGAIAQDIDVDLPPPTVGKRFSDRNVHAVLEPALAKIQDCQKRNNAEAADVALRQLKDGELDMAGMLG